MSWLHFFGYVPCWLYPLCILSQNCETRSLDFIFFFLTMAHVVCKTFKILAKIGVLIVFLTVLPWMCAYSNGYAMVTRILLNVVTQQWHGCLIDNILYSYYLCFLFLLTLIGMVFLAPLPPPLGLFLFVWPMLPSLHCIFKLATHIRHHLDHFHSLATSCMWFLLMNIGPLYSSPTYIFLV